MRQFIVNRHIRSVDYPLLEELAAFDSNEFIECLHNMFNMHKERSDQELTRAIAFTRHESKRRIYEKAREFLQRYDWAVAWHMVRVIEDL